MRRANHYKTRKLTKLAKPGKKSRTKSTDKFVEQIAWKHPKPNAEYGVVTGCDANHEWMLPWWYAHFRRFNQHPVCFVDLGMSTDMARWCEVKGSYADLRAVPAKRQWFKKPLAILACPFKKVLWIDLDCEIRGAIDPLFDYIVDDKLALTLDPHNPWVKTKDCVASGIVGADYGNKLVLLWARGCMTRNKLRGDQEVLNEILQGKRDRVSIMPPEYQWLRIDGDNVDALIMHWTGTKGKDYIARAMGLPPSIGRRYRTTINPRRLPTKGRVNRKITSLLVNNRIKKKIKAHAPSRTTAPPTHKKPKLRKLKLPKKPKS